MRGFTIFHFRGGRIVEESIVATNVLAVKQYISEKHLVALKIQEN